MKDMLSRAKQINEELKAIRRHCHQNPEVGLDMPNTYAYVTAQLEAMGYAPQRVGQYSITATVGGKKPGKVFLIRGDMDALPLGEETDLPFKSENGKMHACGHDCHTAMMLGAAKLLKEREDELEGTVKLFFQTAEETLQGAREAVEDGLLENPTVDAAMMIHIMSATDIPDGTLIAADDGACYASADWYQVDVQGKGGHGAAPHETISAVNIITAINAGIQEIISVMVPASGHAVATVGQIHAGDTSNIIPDTAFLSGTIRAYDEGIRQTVKQSLERMAKHVAEARGGSATVTYTNTSPAVLNNAETCRDIMGYVAQVLGADKVVRGWEKGPDEGKSSGSEDFAYIAQKVPSGVFWLAAGQISEGYTYPGHNPKVDFNEEALYYGAAAYASAAMGWLREHK